MTEMVETAAILNRATNRSLVILDEIGRGTATFDGLSIAWACLEYLHTVSLCRGLFATHYHELTALTNTLPGLAPAVMEVREWKGDVIFLHSVAKGVADRSYGIHVAQLAGLPPSVIARAREVLSLLEKEDRGRLSFDLPLFSQRSCAASSSSSPPPSSPLPPPEKTALERMLAEINPDSLTRREALEFLYKLKAGL